MKKHYSPRLPLSALRTTLAITFATLTIPGHPGYAAKATASDAAQPTANTMRALAARISEGDQAAFDELRSTATALYEGIDYEVDGGRVSNNYGLMNAAFLPLGQDIIKGNKAAFQAVKNCLKIPHLSSFAPHALSEAAAGGHKEALDILLDYKKYGILESSTVGAMIKPASANIQAAVDFMIEEINDPNNSALSVMIADGLKGAADKGNAKAKAALAKLEKKSKESAAEQPPPVAETVSVGAAAPELSVGSWIQGEPVTAFDKDKVYLVEFWATWCGPCVGSIPHLNELHLKYKDKGLVVIGQNVFEHDQSLAAPLVKKMGNRMTYRVALDDMSKSKHGVMATTWMQASGHGGIPTAFLVGKDGKIAWIGHPMQLKESKIEEALNQ